MAIAKWLRAAAKGSWQPLALGLSGLWAALVVLMALISSDPGQNYVARLLIVPIVALWCVGHAVGWVSRALRPHDATVPPANAFDAGAASLPKSAALWWLASLLVCVAAIAGAFALQSGPDGNDLLHQVARLAGSMFVIAVLATAAYRGIRPRTSIARARFVLATALLGAAFVLWQAFDDTQRVGPPPAHPASAESAASKDNRLAARSEKSAKTRREASAQKAADPSELPEAVEWSGPLSEAMRRHREDYLALASKWDADVADLQFESMLTPATLTSSEGRKQNRERLEKFKMLLAGYLDRLDAAQHDYRADVLAIDIPEPQRKDFLDDFEGAYAASVAETRKLNAEFERVELEIAKTILAVTDLMEREDDAVTVGPDGRTLLFRSDAAAHEYNALLKALEKTTAEEDVVMAKSSEAFQRRTDSLNAATATDLR